jgi:hypothetical protein
VVLDNYTSDSTGRRDCADCPAGLSQCVSEHVDLGLCVKERIRNQLQTQLREGRLMVVGGIKTFALVVEGDSRRTERTRERAKRS